MINRTLVKPYIEYVDGKPILGTGDLRIKHEGLVGPYPPYNKNRDRNEAEPEKWAYGGIYSGSIIKNESYKKLADFIEKSKVCPHSFELKKYEFHSKNYLILPIMMPTELGGNYDYEIVCVNN